GEPELQRRDRRSSIEQGAHLCRAELAQAAERLDPRKGADADDAEPGARHLRGSKPVEELKKLELVEKIVLEPQRYLVITLRRREMPVSQLEVAENLVVRQCRPGKVGGSHFRGGGKPEPGREGPLRHGIAPRQHVVVGIETLQRVGRDVAVRNVQTEHHGSPNSGIQSYSVKQSLSPWSTPRCISARHPRFAIAAGTGSAAFVRAENRNSLGPLRRDT